MEKYKKYYGIILFCALVLTVVYVGYQMTMPNYNTYLSEKAKVEKAQKKVDDLNNKLQIVQNKIKKIKDSIVSSQKKIYSPVESDLGDETLFFTLYNDVIEMLHANSIKIQAIDYQYNPNTDNFVKFGKDVYFVCDINMELISNYVNLGKLIQDIYQYPYYIRINDLEVKPYAKDKKILLSSLSLRLYAHTEPEEAVEAATTPAVPALDGANTALPQ